MAAAGESETLEFKKTTGGEQATKTVCAFLNHRGGCVLFGVRRDGGVVRQQVSDKTIKEMSDEFHQIHLMVSPRVERVSVGDDREVTAVSVDEGTMRPYVYRGTAYRRIGNTTVSISMDDYDQLTVGRVHRGRRWEDQIAAGWSVDDLDAEEIRRTVAEAVRQGRLNEPVSRWTCCAGWAFCVMMRRFAPPRSCSAMPSV